MPKLLKKVISFMDTLMMLQVLYTIGSESQLAKLPKLAKSQKALLLHYHTFIMCLNMPMLHGKTVRKLLWLERTMFGKTCSMPLRLTRRRMSSLFQMIAKMKNQHGFIT